MQMKRLKSAEFDKMIIESIDEVYCFDQGTDDLLFYFDQIKSGEITSESDVVYAEGRQGVQLAAFDRNKTAGFTCENGYVQAGAIAVQLGSDLENGTTKFDVMEILESQVDSSDPPVATGVFTATETPSKLIGVYLTNEDGSSKRRLDPSEYDLNGKNITTIKYVVDNTTGTYYLVDGKYTTVAPTGTYTGDMYSIDTTSAGYEEILAHYEASTAKGKKIINAGDKFSKNIKLVINFVAQEPCSGDKYLMQCIMPNAKASGSFSLSAGNDPAVHNFEATALLDVCSKDKELFTITMV